MDIDLELKQLIIERLFLELTPDDIDVTAPLEDYQVDSFLLLEIIVALEEKFEVKFEPEDITADTLRSIESLRMLVHSKQP